MTWEAFLIPALSAMGGWLLRHYGFGAPTPSVPQQVPASGGAVPPPPATADWRTELRTIIADVLEEMLPAPTPPATVPLKPKGA